MRGPLVVHISATGALAPLIQVEVGTEISGTVESVLVDFNQSVEKGQTLARINTERLEASTAQARASLALAEAQRAEAEARVFETQSYLERQAARFRYERRRRAYAIGTRCGSGGVRPGRRK